MIWSLFDCAACAILPAVCAIKWSRLTLFERTPPQQRPAFCGAARCVQNSRLSQQMPASLNIFISIRVSISKGMQVNPPPRGKGMTQCFLCFFSFFLFFFFPSAATAGAALTRRERNHGRIISSRGEIFFFSFSYAQPSVRNDLKKSLKKKLMNDNLCRRTILSCSKFALKPNNLSQNTFSFSKK